MTNDIQIKAIKEAETDFALEMVVKSWENDNLDIVDMNDQLEALVNLVEGEISFDTFLKQSKLESQKQAIFN